MTFFAEPWPYLDPADDFERLSGQRYALLFDSNCPGAPGNHFSYFCWAPIEIIEAKDGLITITNREQVSTFAGDPFDILHGRVELYGMDKAYDPDLPPFQGGAAGMFGYDLGRGLETLPEEAQDELNCPDMMIGIYDQIIAYDHELEKAWLIIHAKDQRDFELKKRMFLSLSSEKTSHTPSAIEWFSDKTNEDYMDDVQHIIDEIYNGEVYQVNLSRRLQAELPNEFSKYGHYQHLRDINPAPFSAFMNFGDIQMASCSPEQFLEVNDDIIVTRPIKGTLPSSKNPDELLNSTKDRAENLMIVDLMRNDLSKVSDYMSVTVPKLFDIETYEGVHHMVSTIASRLRPGKTSIDVLKSCFPGGSITGAPKIRAMEMIEDLEPFRRGPYCGSLGMIGFDGYMNTSITIRTLIYRNDSVYLQTGGGIVADSVPGKELDETLDKAAKILESFEQKTWWKIA